MQNFWQQVELQLKSLGCLEAMQLRPGASEHEIDQLELHLGATLPAPFRQLFMLHDGQDGFGLVYGQKLLSIQDIRKQWDAWRSIDESDMNADCAEFMSSVPEGSIKPMYCNRAWIPLTHDGGGNHIGFDLDPGERGTSGQIIVFGRDEDAKILLSSSLSEFLPVWMASLNQVSWNGKY